MVAIKYFFLAMLGLGAAGCAVTSDYHPALVEVPQRWNVQPAGALPVSVPQSAVRWWSLFKDAELDSLIERAVQANLDVELARTRLLGVRNQLGIVAGSFAPSLTAKASYAREKESQNAPAPLMVDRLGALEVPGQAENLFQTGLDASWEIDIFGGQRRSLEAARASVEVAGLDRDGVILSLLAEVARTYLELRTTQRAMVVANEDLAVRNELAGLVSARYAAGMATFDEVPRARLLARLPAAELASMESRRKNAINRLGTLLGLWPGALAAELQTPASSVFASPDIAVGLPSDLLRQRPDVLRAERNMALTSARLGVATADLYPHFSLNGSAGLASVSAADFFSAGSLLWRIGPTLTWPLLQRGQVVATVEVRNLQQQEAAIEYRKAILLALEDADNAISAYAQQRQSYARMDGAKSDSQAAFNMANSRYTGGMADYREVLDARLVNLQAQAEQLQGEASVALAAVALYKALGGGWAAVRQDAQLGALGTGCVRGALPAKGVQPCSSLP